MIILQYAASLASCGYCYKHYCRICSEKKNEAYQLPIRKSTDLIRIDGVVDETGWAQAAIATDFFMVTPMDTSKARVRTDVKMTYDDDDIITARGVSVIMHYPVHTL
ncbi:MAG: hypothetical protein U5K54_16290 [Cytophagales bacterium]|nr:hypothetical protein [Cytophagales bacterium]